MTEKPVILLTFANDQEGSRYLRDLPEEQRRLREILRNANERGLFHLEILPNATADEIAEAFQRFQRRVAIFHYGGHAGQAGLLVESSGRGSRTIHSPSLANFFREHGAPYLVFLNGCATWGQVRGLHKAGVQAVIGTARAVRDQPARKLAEKFYGRIAAGENLDTAFRHAQSVVGLVDDAADAYPRAFIDSEVIERVNSERDLVPIGASGEIDDEGLPWKLSIAADSPLAGEWSLLTIDPLWGLERPELPQPEAPYIGLRPFTRQDAGVFFGRRAEIRELYNAVVTPGRRPLIFFYGQSGVGKSSVLEAGLFPWLSLCRTVRCVRRDPTLGLLGTLRYELSSAGGKDTIDNTTDLAKLCEEVAARPPGLHLVIVVDQAEEAFTKPCRTFVTDSPASSEAGAQAELAAFFRELKGILYGPDVRPRGPIVMLGFRKEWLANFSRAAREAGLSPDEVFLKPLGRVGIIEAIEGPSHVTSRARSARPEIVDSGLAEHIAKDILKFVADPDKNRVYPLGPALQSLLERMWLDAKKLNDVEPVFNRELFIAVQRAGYGLDRYLERGLSALETWCPETVRSGLALDLLEYHTTPLGIANQRDSAELRARYKHRNDMLDKLVDECTSNYLLIAVPPPAPSGTTSLPHDTLAPVVRARFHDSDRPGQKARRILRARAGEWKKRQSGTPLDEQDLAAVERGENGMRTKTIAEERLVAASRRKYFRRYGLGMFLLSLAIPFSAIGAYLANGTRYEEAVGASFGFAILMWGTWVIARRIRKSPAERRGVGFAVTALALLLFFLVRQELFSLQDLTGLTTGNSGIGIFYTFIYVLAGYGLFALAFTASSVWHGGRAWATIASLAVVAVVVTGCVSSTLRCVRQFARLVAAAREVAVAHGNYPTVNYQLSVSGMRLHVHVHNVNFEPARDEVLARVEQLIPKDLPRDVHSSGFNRAPVLDIREAGGVEKFSESVAASLRVAIGDEAVCYSRPPSVAVFPVLGDPKDRTPISHTVWNAILKDLHDLGPAVGTILQGDELAVKMQRSRLEIRPEYILNPNLIANCLVDLDSRNGIYIVEQSYCIFIYLVCTDGRFVVLGQLLKREPRIDTPLPGPTTLPAVGMPVQGPVPR